MLDLTNKVALVTGATSGIGLAIAEGLAEAGAKVVINGLGSPDQIEDAVNAISNRGPANAFHHPADLRKPDDIYEMVEGIKEGLGNIDILVNNAGIQHTARVEDFPRDTWDKVLAVNLSSAFHTTAAVLKDMQKNDYGRIINIASVHGLVASKEKAAYVAAKHGIIGLTKVTALENAAANITCNAICPAWTLTPLVQAQIDRKAQAEGVDTAAATEAILLEKEPSLRFTKVEDIAAAALFLLSSAGDNMTGSSITMDGGWTAQ